MLLALVSAAYSKGKYVENHTDFSIYDGALADAIGDLHTDADWSRNSVSYFGNVHCS